ncbi:FMN-binding protein [Candidatus Woesearchaeota archaeon]|nr:FMN-binding protein [Candidatus Woesearchaeota archaeon]
MKSETPKLVLTLVVICVIAAAALSIVYKITYPKIRAEAVKEMRATLDRVLPEATAFDEPGVPEEILEQKEGVKAIFIGYNQNRDITGIAAVVEGAGYQDYIQLLVVVSADLKEIKSIEILDQKETPGLGSRITEKEFLDQFKGELKEEYDAITGATVSSTTIINLVNKAIEDLAKIIEPEEVEEEGTSEEEPSGEEVEEAPEEEPEVDAETEASPEWNGTPTPGWNET